MVRSWEVFKVLTLDLGLQLSEGDKQVGSVRKENDNCLRCPRRFLLLVSARGTGNPLHCAHLGRVYLLGMC